MSGDDKKMKCDGEKSQKRKLDAGSDEVKSANDWEHVDLGDDSRKNKFLRLMGASKKEHHGKIVIGEKTSSHGRSKEETEKLSEDLEEQYKQGLEMKLSGHTRKHVGLGFQDDDDDNNDGGDGSSSNNHSSSSKKNGDDDDDDDDEDHRPPSQRHRHKQMSRDSKKRREKNDEVCDGSNNDNDDKNNKSRDRKEDGKKNKDDSEDSSKKGDSDETGKRKDSEKSESKSTTAKKFGLFVKAGDL